jgi:hypothetical protein
MPFGNEFEIQKRIPGERFYRTVESYSMKTLALLHAKDLKELNPQLDVRINSHSGYEEVN